MFGTISTDRAVALYKAKTVDHCLCRVISFAKKAQAGGEGAWKEDQRETGIKMAIHVPRGT